MKTWKFLKKLIVISIGLPLFILGIILIPLPGPGFLIMLLALLILSTEIAWVQPYRDRSVEKLKKLWAEYKSKQAEINRKYK